MNLPCLVGDREENVHADDVQSDAGLVGRLLGTRGKPGSDRQSSPQAQPRQTSASLSSPLFEYTNWPGSTGNKSAQRAGRLGAHVQPEFLQKSPAQFAQPSVIRALGEIDGRDRGLAACGLGDDVSPSGSTIRVGKL